MLSINLVLLTIEEINCYVYDGKMKGRTHRIALYQRMIKIK